MPKRQSFVRCMLSEFENACQDMQRHLSWAILTQQTNVLLRGLATCLPCLYGTGSVRAYALKRAGQGPKPSTSSGQRQHVQAVRLYVKL